MAVIEMVVAIRQRPPFDDLNLCQRKRYKLCVYHFSRVQTLREMAVFPFAVRLIIAFPLAPPRRAKARERKSKNSYAVWVSGLRLTLYSTSLVTLSLSVSL